MQWCSVAHMPSFAVSRCFHGQLHCLLAAFEVQVEEDEKFIFQHQKCNCCIGHRLSEAQRENAHTS